MPTVLLAVVVVLSVLGASGCDGVRASAGARRDPEPSTTCPFGLRGARVELENTADGSALTLHAFGDVEDIRRRAIDAAAMYGPGAHQGAGHEGRHGEGKHHGFGLAQLGVPITAVAENTADGARIRVWPKHPEDLDKMRTALAERESRARAGKCPKP